jgi:hypothetical protein
MTSSQRLAKHAVEYWRKVNESGRRWATVEIFINGPTVNARVDVGHWVDRGYGREKEIAIKTRTYSIDFYDKVVYHDQAHC